MRRGAVAGVLSSLIAIAVVLTILELGHGRSPTGRRQPAATPSSYRPLTSILGVLRHPQTNPDLDHALLKELKRELHDRIDLGLSGTPVISLVRLAGVTPWGARIFLIPYVPPTREQISRLSGRLRNVARPKGIAAA